MPHLALHHYGFLTANISVWLIENELLFGKPFKVSCTITVSSQKAKIAFVQQKENDVLAELIEPMEENAHLKKMIAKGITVYHTGYATPANEFDAVLKSFEKTGAYALPVFKSEAFENRRCVFIVTKNLGLIEIIEQ
jgi:hypothetical protein